MTNQVLLSNADPENPRIPAAASKHARKEFGHFGKEK
jgi:hypothetical protein